MTERFPDRRRSGRRVMVAEQRQSQDGSSHTVLVPTQLLPIESDMLAALYYLTENDPRQPEIDGYSLIRQMYPDLVAAKHGFGTYYKVLYRLSQWGYVNHHEEFLPMGMNTGFPEVGPGVMKKLYRVTEAGRKRLETEKTSDDPYKRLVKTIFAQG